jgi:hypothetical protein
VPKDGSSIDGSGSSQGQAGPRSETPANDEAKCNMENSPEVAVAEESEAQDMKIEIKIEARTSS